MEHNVGQGGPSKTWNVSLKVGPRQKIRYFTTWHILIDYVTCRSLFAHAELVCKIPLLARTRDALGLKAQTAGQARRWGILYTRYPIVARALGLAAAFRPSARASKGILHTTCIHTRSVRYWLVIAR